MLDTEIHILKCTVSKTSKSVAIWLWYQNTINREELLLLLGYASICIMLRKVSTHNSWGITENLRQFRNLNNFNYYS